MSHGRASGRDVAGDTSGPVPSRPGPVHSGWMTDAITGPQSSVLSATRRGALHHVELWVPDLARALGEWGWLLRDLGYDLFQDWPAGRSWSLGGTYLVVEQSPASTADRHERLRPGLNHLAFHAGTRDQLDDLMARAPGHGWRPLFEERYPFAGGPQHYAGYLENSDGFEVELAAD